MFFISIFGIQDKEKYIGTCNNIICHSCGRLSKYEVYKVYRYFHIFFMPIFNWNVRFIVIIPCCNSLYELDPIVGREFEKNPNTQIKEENLRRVDNMPFKYCSNCKRNIFAEYNFCPYCGGKL